jgi:hypothetical protein
MIILTHGKYKENAGFIFFGKDKELNLVREGDRREEVCTPNFLGTLLECISLEYISTSKLEKIIEISGEKIKERSIKIENRVKKIHKRVKINNNGRIQGYQIDIAPVWHKGLSTNERACGRWKYGNI